MFDEQNVLPHSFDGHRHNRAKESDELKDDFIGMVSHELKTPLTVVIGSSILPCRRTNRRREEGVLSDAIAVPKAWPDIGEPSELSRSQRTAGAGKASGHIKEVACEVRAKMKDRYSTHRIYG